MNQFIHGVARAIAESFSLPGPILEIGAYQVPGQRGLAELRPLFPGKPYLGVDVRPGPGVDHVASVEELPFADGTVGTILALNTFEHVARFWRGFEEIRRVLRPDGALLVSCPFYFHIHHHPRDYWRFTPEALEFLLEDYPTRITGWQGPAAKPLHVWALAFRAAQAVSAEEFARYRELMGRYARQPLPWSKKWRYLLGRLICGRRPFVPYLEQEHWETECCPFMLSDRPDTRWTRHEPHTSGRSLGMRNEQNTLHKR
jgi:SAM-dependent methyltransferase